MRRSLIVLLNSAEWYVVEHKPEVDAAYVVLI